MAESKSSKDREKSEEIISIYIHAEHLLENNFIHTTGAWLGQLVQHDGY